MKQRTIVMAATVLFLAAALTGSAQYFGIGTATPQTTLDLEGTGPNHLIRLRDNSGGPTVRLALNSGFAGMPYIGTDGPRGFGIVANNLQLITASQTGNVGINTTIPDASAILDINSNNRGLLVPRLTTAQRTAITAPATGLLVFDTDANTFFFYGGAAWARVSGTSELERLTENGRTGYRILNRPAANYGNIGQDAVDLSFSGVASTVLGATGNFSFASGQQTTAAGFSSTAMGYLSLAQSSYAVAMGFCDTAIGLGAIAAGYYASATNDFSVSIGNRTIASGINAIAMGERSNASGINAIAMGDRAAAMGNHAVALGIADTATGTGSFAAGYFARATGEFSVAIGYDANAAGHSALALGRGCEALGTSSTAVGFRTTATGNGSTALGNTTFSRGNASMAMGFNTVAKSYAELVAGHFNDTLAVANGSAFRADTNRLFTVGNGLNAASLKTAFVIQQNGFVGIGVRSPASLLHVNGEVGINGNNALELGADVAGKEPNAGKIGYQTFTPGALDIIGAGTNSANRRIRLWAEGGLELVGTIVQESVQVPTLLAGWQSFGATYAPVDFWKDREGMVHLRGLIGSGTATNGTILFNLPAGYRPSGGRLMFAVLTNNGVGRVDISAAGDVVIESLPGNTWLNLNGISFRTN
jgi:hypothetical protein